MSAQAGAGGIAIGTYHAMPHGGVPAFPQRRTERPHQIGAIPREADCYQRRTAVAALNQESATDQTTGTHVLTGTAGVGKTQLAALYVRDAWRSGRLDLLLWINANTRAGVVTVYAQAASELLGADSGSPEQAAVTFLAWLEHKAQAQPCRWLIVLDDVSDPGDLRHLWPPDSPYGRTVVTTRRRDAALSGGGRRMVTVGLFEPEEAVAYLSSSLSDHGSDESKDTLADLAKDLGYLPLALSQGVAFMLDAGLDAAAYRDLLADGARNLAELLPEQRTLPDDQDAPMAAAWALSIDHANGLRPEGLARPMLQLAAMLDANGIPTEVLTGGPALDHLSTSVRGRHRRGQQHGECTAEEALGALRALHRLNLIDHTPGASPQGVRVHQLIQRTVRDALAPAEYERLVRTAADALTAVWPDIERDTGLAQTLRANTTALMLHGQDALYRPHLHPVLHRIGRSLGKTGQVSAARDYFDDLVGKLRRYCGPDHLDTLLARGGHARWRGEAGDASGAADETAGLLRDVLRVLGRDHSHTLTTLSNLARWRGEAGDPEGAASATADLLRDRTRILGPDHELTLSTRSNLQYWRGRTGDPADAAVATGELLEDMLRILGPDHPHTLTARSHLAHVRGRAGDHKAAAAATAELLEDQERILGPDHPDTLTTRHELARWRGEAGDALGAADSLAALLKDRSRVLGPDHPRTLATRSNLACWRSEAGDRAGAVSLTEELLRDMLRVLGPDHPYTRIARANLVRWLEQPEDDGTPIPY
ncbi:tetratricopeptide repeat protein [Streptomyces triticiradicis]|uniref:Tetratricopeptide repeat protein n=1 Tax=Streptomyces triticiradicis TaxID=2651189 RepID=A0A7J5D756_9ACTN|nr:tetratricopeptide repeat protein [Streptomyces triticiradicis]KAB1980780.1 tetratricopeptide repeat protein [Streptomyces triticiradicis]